MHERRTVADHMEDLIISGGGNVYSAEIEDRLLVRLDVVGWAAMSVPDAWPGRGSR